MRAVGLIADCPCGVEESAMVVPVLIVVVLGVGSLQPPAPSLRKGEGNSPQRQAEPAQNKPAPTTTDERGTESRPAVVRIEKSKEAGQREQEDREQEATNKRWMLWLTGATLFVIGYQTLVLWNQNRIMQKQTGLMHGQMKHTEIAAEAAKSSARTAEIALQAGQRAYVVFSKWAVEPPIVFGEPPQLSFTLKNVGHTPAVITSRAGSLVVSNERRIPDLQLADAAMGDHVLPPGAPIKHVLAEFSSLESDVIASVANGQQFLFAFQRVAYRDAFGVMHFIEEVARLRVRDGVWDFPSSDRRTHTDLP
jgi:hypothetical protein